jgi:hypothetical protein
VQKEVATIETLVQDAMGRQQQGNANPLCQVHRVIACLDVDRF